MSKLATQDLDWQRGSLLKMCFLVFKDSIGILKGLIKFIEGLIEREINF